ncbi:hypothetical protein [Candidatus Deianiraea vastatrix]|uniref:PD(D/E)XK endonuclease domain-containing protein n=1 Tax=Candidatus Deianiraea vastatrix TaxID=2163644 RepID=A0A5B8XE69_9RICK|nr:hypothetical protein [Candidatus Deianiraea vastatrix]QED23612.1 hypothetical protein Deia_00825 [Candidatus Deianiraea vastatrix]
MKKNKRQNTKCESEGSEFLVLGNLMIRGIWAYKTYTNMPGYDLIAINPISQKQCKIQVKSRWATNANYAFPLKNLECDFVVFCRLNRGAGPSFKNRRHTAIKDPQYWVVPIENAKTTVKTGKFSNCKINKIENIDSFQNNWQLINDFLI